MVSLIDRSKALARKVAESPAQPPTIVEFGRDRVVGGPGGAQPERELRPQLDYFEVRVNELFLSRERRWLSEYDPLVYVVSEFRYGGELQAIPFIVGPQLVKAGGTAPPGDGGMVLNDTRVAGPHPFRGHLALTVVLCQVERVNYARTVLSTLENVASAFDFAAAVTPYVKVAGVIMDGVDTLFGDQGPAKSLALHRAEFDPSRTLESPLYFALIAETDVDASQLWVHKRRLVQGPSAEDGTPYRDSDFVLCSIVADDKRQDVDSLPFQTLWGMTRDESQRAINDALWERARAMLFSLAEAVRASPDLTESHAEDLVDHYTERAVMFRDSARRMAALSGESHALTDGQKRSSSILGL